MTSSEQKRKLLKAKIAVALRDELGRVPKEDEINQVFTLTRVTYMLLEFRHPPFLNRLSSGFQALRPRLEPVVSRL